MSVGELNVSRPEGAAARSRRETRRRLIEAGTELFARRGLYGATSSEIARQAGVAAGTFYLHFKDKQELFREIVFVALAQLRQREDAAAARASGRVEELRARYHELLRFADENRNLVGVLFGRRHEAAGLGEDVLDAILPGLEERMREGDRETHLHPAVAAQALAAMVSRVLAWWVEDPRRASRDEVVETLLRLHPLVRTLEGARSRETQET
jgi:AcrR family transcriptional regulator